MVTLSASLRKLFQGYTTELRFNQLAEFWGVYTQPEHGWLHEPDLLGMLLQDPIGTRFAWEGLSRTGRDILHQMIALDIMDGAPREDMQKLLQLSDEEFQKGLTELDERLMLFEDRPSAKIRLRMENLGQQSNRIFIIPKEFRTLFGAIDNEIYGSGDRAQLKMFDLLKTYELTELQSMGQLYEMGIYDAARYFYNSKEGFAKSLAGKLVQPAAIEFAWAKLDETAQNICRFLCRMDGSIEPTQLREQLGLNNFVLSSALHLLERYGLAFDTFSGQTRKIFIGRGVFKVLRRTINELDEAKKARESLTMNILPVAPDLIKEGGQLLYDLAVIVGAVYQQIIEPTQSGYVPKRIANKLTPLLHGSRLHYYDGSNHYLDMVFSIASGLGLIELAAQAGQKSRYVAGSHLEEWMGLDLASQESKLLSFWWSSRSTSWSDIAGANYHSDGYGFYIDMHAARRALMEYLVQACQAEQWYTRESLLQVVKESDPLLLRSGSGYSPYGSGNITQTRKNVLARWDTNDGELITGMLDSTLSELGLVSTGNMQERLGAQGNQGNSYAFKLNELAVQAMARVASGVEIVSTLTKPKQTLIIQPNFELMLLEPDYTTLYQLLPFARVEQVEMVSRLTMTQESVRRGVEAGWGVERTLQTLQSLSVRELPQNVLYTLQDWDRLYKDATLSQVLLLEMSSESVADEIVSSPKFRSLALRRLGPCAVAVTGDVSLQVLRTTMEKEGVILRVQGDILVATSVNDRWR